MSETEAILGHVDPARSRIAFILTGIMLAVYAGFLLLIAFDKPWLGTLILPGLSIGILLGALMIVVACLLTFYYVWWANANLDTSSAPLEQ